MEQKTPMLKHDHPADPRDCFGVVAENFARLRRGSERVGFFLYVAHNDEPLDDSHYLGNTAFAAGALKKLVKVVSESHEFGHCAHCDRVAHALLSADRAFDLAMFGAEKKC